MSSDQKNIIRTLLIRCRCLNSTFIKNIPTVYDKTHCTRDHVGGGHRCRVGNIFRFFFFLVSYSNTIMLCKLRLLFIYLFILV